MSLARVFGFGHFLYFSRGNEGRRGTDFYDTARDLAANLGTNTCRCASLQQEARREIRKKEKKKKKRERRKNCSSTMKWIPSCNKLRGPIYNITRLSRLKTGAENIGDDNKRSGFLRFIWVTVITRETVPKKAARGKRKKEREKENTVKIISRNRCFPERKESACGPSKVAGDSFGEKFRPTYKNSYGSSHKLQKS